MIGETASGIKLPECVCVCKRYERRGAFEPTTLSSQRLELTNSPAQDS